MTNCEPVASAASLLTAMSDVLNVAPAATVITVGNSSAKIPPGSITHTTLAISHRHAKIHAYS